MDNKTARVADGVWAVEVAFGVNAYVLANNGVDDGEGLTLVDSGLRSGGPRLVRSVRMLGFDPASMRDLLLTHWHPDHTGSAARFATSTAATRVRAGREDLAAVRGDQRRPQRYVDRDELTPLGRMYARFVGPGAPVPSAEPLDDGEELAVAGGLRVVAAPGHTPGSLAFHVASRGVLVAGDAVMNLGRLTRGPGFVRSARSSEVATLRRLAALDFDVLACGHGPLVRTGGRERLERLSARLAQR